MIKVSKHPHKHGLFPTLKLASCHVFIATLFTTLLVNTVPTTSLHAQSGFGHPVRNVRVTSLFGESRGDHFHTGVDFAGEQPILAVSDGEIIFKNDTSKNPRALRLGMGNFLVIAHKNNIRSHYLHLEDGSIETFIGDKTTVQKGQSVAFMGNSGYSLGKHLHLDIINALEKKIYNPVSILPPLVDATAPTIVAFLLKVNDNLYSIRKRSVFKFFTESELYVVAWDRFTPSRRGRLNKQGVHGVKVLEVWQDDLLLRRYDFSVMEAKNQSLQLASGQTFDETYGLPFNYRISNFSPNESSHTFRIEAVDFFNNVSTSSYTMFFR